MLPNETNAAEFAPPPGVDIDLSSEYVIEANQIDTLILNNIDDRNNITFGFLSSNQISGMSMAQNVRINGQGPFSGIYYDNIEIVELNLGDGVANITVESTPGDAIHILNLGGGDDVVTVRTLAGPLIVNGNGG
eukprot:15062331-Ditylum_brightwellii.AAC.1